MPASTQFITNQSPAAGTSYSSAAQTFNINTSCQVGCTNGGAAPTTTPYIQFWIANASGVYYLAETRTCSLAPNYTSHQVFDCADYAGAHPGSGDPNSLYTIPGTGMVVLTNFKVIVFSGLGNASTFNAYLN